MDDKVKELLDKIRGTASVAADAAADTARVAGKKAGQMVDVAKLNVQLFDLNGDFNDILRRLGQVMYDTHRGQTPEGDPVTELLAEADETAAKVEEVKSRIADLRQSRSCPTCGAQMKITKWYPQQGKRYLTMTTCPEHGPYLLRVRLVPEEGGTLQANRMLYEADSQTAQSYARLQQKPRRPRRRRRSKAARTAPPQA